MATASEALPCPIGTKRSSAHIEGEGGGGGEEREVAAAFCGSGSGAPGKVPRIAEARRVVSPSPSQGPPIRPPEKHQPDANASGGNVVEDDAAASDADGGGTKEEEVPFHTHDLVVATLSFLADIEAPSELLEISKSCKSFRAAALDNILWKEMCDRKWKTKFGYQFRMRRAEEDASSMSGGGDDSEFDLSVSSSPEIRPHPTASSDKVKCPEAGFWYHRYWNELKMSTVDRITLSDLREWQWSACLWFAILDDDEPTILQSGLRETIGNGLRFLEDNTVIGGEAVPPYCIQGNGSIVNTLQDANERCSAWTFHVQRRSNWGWELWSQYFVLRPYHKNEELAELWDDYQDELIHQDKKEGVHIAREGAEGTTSRIVPQSMADKLEW